ncbi:MAG: hypothetical protein ACYTBS_15610 [Planctomycetota bacterium]|jgi:hypothetical protein
MFDLNEEILKWRSSLSEADSLDKPAVSELESHLRDEIDSLTSLNLSEEESFCLARRRLGGAGDLSNEFAKINRSAVLRGRLFWMAAGILAYMLAIQIGGAASRLSVLFAGLGGLRGPGLGVVAVVSELLVLGSILYLAYRAHGRMCNSHGFSRWANDSTKKIALFAGLAVLFIVIGLTATEMVGTAGAVRLMGSREYAHAALVSNCTHLGLKLLLPLVMVLMMVLLRRPRSGETPA